MAKISEEVKSAKMGELSNLIQQYENGERENINTSEYDMWVKVLSMLKVATIEENIYDDFLKNPTHYKVENEEIIYNENWEAEAAAKEQQRIAQLHMTKLDFFKNVLQPNGITYAALEQVIATNEILKATWNLCNHVYRGDEVLNEFIFEQIPSLTPKELTRIFERFAVTD